MTVWIYTRSSELIVFDSEETANAWFAKHDPEGVAFRYPVISSRDARRRPDSSQDQ